MKRLGLVLALVLALGGTLAAVALGATPGTNVLVSRPSGFGALPTPTTNHSSTATGGIDELGGASPRTVADVNSNRYVAFVSEADGLSDADDNRVTNVYVRDRNLNTTILVSRANGPGGAGANGTSNQPSISADGRWVAFKSDATNLAAGVSGGATHIYVRDLLSGETRLIDRADGPDGDIANSDSFNPSLTVDNNNPVVAFGSVASNLDGSTTVAQVYVRQSNDTEMVSLTDDQTANPNTPGNFSSASPSISTNADHVAFVSSATNLSLSPDGNMLSDVYVRQLAGNDTVPVSISNGVFGDGASSEPSISGDGGEVAFTSEATNLNSDDTDAGKDVYARSLSALGPVVVSQSSDGLTSANQAASEPAITDNGAAVVFASGATNLTAGDTNGLKDVFLRSAVFGIGSTSLLSNPTDGVAADGHSSAPSIGRATTIQGNNLVVFQSTADNMGTDDENDFQQVYVVPTGIIVGPRTASHISRPTGTGAFRSGVNASTLRPELRSSEPAVSMSQDGRYTLFMSAADYLSTEDDDRFVNLFRRDNMTGATVLVSRADGLAGAPANASSGHLGGGGLGVGSVAGAPSISADGNRIAFSTAASNLVGDDSNGTLDVFVRDVAAGTTAMASRQSSGSAIPAPSGDPAISGNGNRVAFVTEFAMDGMDGNNLPDVHLRDLSAGTTVIVSRRGPAGPTGNDSSSEPALDADGSHVAFATGASDLDPPFTDANGVGDVMLRDVAAGQTTLVSRQLGPVMNTGNDVSTAPAINADGNLVAFTSDATDVGTGVDLNGGIRDVFVRNMPAGTATLVSRTSGAEGVSGNQGAERASISADGTRIAFESFSTDLVPGDGNAALDVFVRDTTANTTELVSAQAASQSGTPSISGNGDCIAFETFSDALLSMPPGTDHHRVVASALRGNCPFEPAPAAGGDTDPPVISKVSIKPKRFLAGKKLRKKTRKRPAVGGRLRYTLSEKASVSVRIDAKLKGRRVKGRCVKPRPGNRKRRRCNRFVKRQTLGANGKLGANRLNITGRVRRRNLKPGPYRITIAATDEAGNASAPKRVSFKVLRKKRRR